MKLHTSHLKWIALITMTIDHIGHYLYPNLIVLRVIGRIAFPMYAFMLAQGYVHSRNPRRYGLRLLLFALGTQALFTLFHVDFVNVLFTFFLSLLALYFVDQNKIGSIVLILLVTNYLNPDYAVYGVGVVMVFYIFRVNKKAQMLGFAILTLIFTCFDLLVRPQLVTIIFGNFSRNWGFFIQLFALLAIPFLLSYDGKKKGGSTQLELKVRDEEIADKNVKGKALIDKGREMVSKYFFYVYYPLHIVVLVLIQGGK